MERMHLNNSYHDEEVHTNVQKTIFDGMENVGIYTKEENNVLKKENGKTGYTVRLHFTEDNDNEKVIKNIQNILIRTYVLNLTSKGGK